MTLTVSTSQVQRASLEVRCEVKVRVQAAVILRFSVLTAARIPGPDFRKKIRNDCSFRSMTCQLKKQKNLQREKERVAGLA